MSDVSKADQFRVKRQADYASIQEFMDLVMSVDPEAEFVLNGTANRILKFGGVVLFSDGSTYRMGLNG